MKTLFISPYSGASLQALADALLSLTDSRKTPPLRLDGNENEPLSVSESDTPLSRSDSRKAPSLRLEDDETAPFSASGSLLARNDSREVPPLRLDENESVPFSVSGADLSDDVRRHYESIFQFGDCGDSREHLLVCCVLMERLRAQKTVFSPIPVGAGAVEPRLLATLNGASVTPSERACTPMFAAFAREYADSFGNIPPMRALQTACGVDPQGGSVSIALGEDDCETPQIVELTCNVDDMTPEALGFAMETFFAEGALEVYTAPLTMKKSRPGVLITVTCRADDREKLLRLFFKHTTTLGVRETSSRRHTLSRSVEKVSTSFGTVRKKISAGYGVTREKYEYDDLSRIARENGIGLEEARARVREEDK